MEKKVRIKKLNHQDDIKRSWAAAYPLTENFEGTLSEDFEKAQSELDPVETNSLHVQPSIKWQDSDSSE